MSKSSAESQSEVNEFTLAAVFDHVDPSAGPGFADDHEVIDDEETLAALLDYLRAGVSVLVTPMRMHDIREPARGPVVPMDFRTDGSWIWTDTITYYLENYRLAPEPGLLSHIKSQGTFTWVPDDAAAARAAAFVLTPPEAGREAVWRVGDETA